MLLIRRGAILTAVATLVVGIGLAEPAQAADSESGSLTCFGSQTVQIIERTSAGITTISAGSRRRTVVKDDWSTGWTNTGLRSASWTVTTSGSMDHAATRALCVGA